MRTICKNLLLGVFVLFLTIQFSATAQTYSKEAKKYITTGDNYMQTDEYDKALDAYLQADKLYPKDPELSYKVGNVYYQLKHETKALPYFEIAKKGGVEEPELIYDLAHCYHKAHKFDQAISYANQYRAMVSPKDKETLKELDQLISYCKNGKIMVANPKGKITIKNLGSGVNSKFNDYAPVISADEATLIFTSRRDVTTGGKTDPETGEYFEDVYLSVKSDSVWSTAETMKNGINTPTHDASVALSPDGHELFIYRATTANGGDLYQSDLVGTVWSEPRPLNSNINTAHWEGSGSVTADEKVLFFASDRKGGIGGTDIYMSKKNDKGQYGVPILLSSKINTSLDEDNPFIHPDGKTLYFSSKGHKSMGGFDIFSCTVNTETGEILTEPENIGYPINTADDDVAFVWSADNKRAYFASEREGGFGERDIYMLIREDADADLAVLKGRIISCDAQKTIAATIIVTDLTTQETIGVYNSNASSGKYTVILPAGKNYGVTVEAQGYLFFSKNVDIPKLDHYVEYKDEICLNKLKVGSKIVLRNVFFDVDKATLRVESEDELERLLKILTLNPDIKIEVSGHTDSDGSDDHNLKLSEARAKTVMDYLITKGISANRLKWKGYGETQPQVPNDSPENKQLNRRTEIKVLEE